MSVWLFRKEHYFSRALLQESLGFVGLFCKRDVCLQGSVEKEPYFDGALLQKSPGFVGFFRKRDVGLYGFLAKENRLFQEATHRMSARA